MTAAGRSANIDGLIRADGLRSDCLRVRCHHRASRRFILRTCTVMGTALIVVLHVILDKVAMAAGRFLHDDDAVTVAR